MFGQKAQNKELDKFAELLAKSIESLFKERGEIVFSRKPVLTRSNIVEYEGRMRVAGMEKFDNEPTYISAVSFFSNARDMEKHNTLGVVVVYVKQDYLATIMKMLQYPPIDDESDDELRDSCGTLCNIIAGRFKSEISAAGYVELEMSHFVNFRNSSFGGVEFCRSEYDKYQIEFVIQDKKQVVVEMSMGPVPRAA
ncbi:MAG: chemotaxis protein CheX [Candidatus Omnitrophota bacterium]